MCRSIERLRPAMGSDEAPASEDDIEAAALQFVRKISGFQRPSTANAEAFNEAVEEIAHISEHLLASLELGKRSHAVAGEVGMRLETERKRVHARA